MKRLAVLLSGRGSNFLAISEAIRTRRLLGVEVGVVLSNRDDAPGLAAARDHGIPAFSIPSAGRKRAEHDGEMVARLHQHKIDLICLAGYMRLLSPGFVTAFPHRILNIHPSLLPAFPGLEAQAQAVAYGVKISGCTVHFVDEQLDHGAIILQRAVKVGDRDTAETLSARILEQEHIAYPEAIARVVSGAYVVSGRQFLQRETPVEERLRQQQS